jgi:hypothetical protein
MPRLAGTNGMSLNAFIYFALLLATCQSNYQKDEGQFGFD